MYCEYACVMLFAGEVMLLAKIKKIYAPSSFFGPLSRWQFEPIKLAYSEASSPNNGADCFSGLGEKDVWNVCVWCIFLSSTTVFVFVLLCSSSISRLSLKPR